MQLIIRVDQWIDKLINFLNELADYFLMISIYIL